MESGAGARERPGSAQLPFIKSPAAGEGGRAPSPPPARSRAATRQPSASGAARLCKTFCSAFGSLPPGLSKDLGLREERKQRRPRGAGNTAVCVGSRQRSRTPAAAPRPRADPPLPRAASAGKRPPLWVCGGYCGASSRGERLAPQPAPCKTTSTTRRSSRRARTAAARRSTTTRGRAAASGRCSSASTSFASSWVSPPRCPWPPAPAPRPLGARRPSQPGGVPARGAPRFLAGAGPPAGRFSGLRRAVSPGRPPQPLQDPSLPCWPLARARPHPTDLPACA